MARPTQQEIDEFNARMSEPDPDDGVDCTIELPSGHKVTMPYKRVKGYLKRQGLDFDDVEIEAAGQEDLSELDESELGNETPRTSAKYFGRKDKT